MTVFDWEARADSASGVAHFQSADEETAYFDNQIQVNNGENTDFLHFFLTDLLPAD